MRPFGHFSHALIRGLSPSFEDSLKQAPPPEPISIELAHQQHNAYTNLLKELIPHITEVAADPKLPDCCFIEDTVVIAGSIAVITYPGAPERRGELTAVKEALEELHFPCIKQLQPPATLDGGDVMYTGNAIWIGISKRTNREAVRQMEAFFEGVCPVYAFQVPQDGHSLHLKSVMSYVDSKHILFADTDSARGLAEQVLAVPELASHHEVVYVPDMVASNVLRVNDTIVMQEGFPHSEAIIADLCSKLGLKLRKLQMSEFIKADGALTCCNVLFNL